MRAVDPAPTSAEPGHDVPSPPRSAAAERSESTRAAREHEAPVPPEPASEPEPPRIWLREELRESAADG